MQADEARPAFAMILQRLAAAGRQARIGFQIQFGEDLLPEREQSASARILETPDPVDSPDLLADQRFQALLERRDLGKRPPVLRKGLERRTGFPRAAERVQQLVVNGRYAYGLEVADRVCLRGRH